MRKVDRERTARYRTVLVNNAIGQFVLSDILIGCRFFGRIDEYDVMSTSEMLVRQEVGREILRNCGIFPGIDQKLKPQKFIAKLARGIEEQRKAKSKER